MLLARSAIWAAPLVTMRSSSLAAMGWPWSASIRRATCISSSKLTLPLGNQSAPRPTGTPISREFSKSINLRARLFVDPFGHMCIEGSNALVGDALNDRIPLRELLSVLGDQRVDESRSMRPQIDVPHQRLSRPPVGTVISL